MPAPAPTPAEARRKGGVFIVFFALAQGKTKSAAEAFVTSMRVYNVLR